ncbi:ankyrin [Aspergillus ambiguus]|uniref:ankyrin repeat domain-containing protein n=1 Tax=Aspergillus ambiguus TaxID=176160 RepID=UPI003CCD1273
MLDRLTFDGVLITTTQNALHFASSKGNLSTVRTLIANKCSARVKDKRGQLPLHRAAAIGSSPIIKILLEEGKSPVNATDMDGLTALHHAISEGHGDAAITLLKAGAETDKRSSDDLLAIDMAPDQTIRSYILQTAEREGLEI